MSCRLDVEMPHDVYASYTKKDVVYNDFYFTIYWEETDQARMGEILRPALEVRVGGFERLLSDPSVPPSQRKEQLLDAAQKLLQDLSGAEGWTKKYIYDEASGELSFVFASMEEFPSGYSAGSFITDRFVCFKASPIILLHIQAWVYDSGGEEEKVCDGYRTVHVYYPPSITEFCISYAGTEKLKKAYVNPFYDGKVTLTWKIQGNLGISCRLCKDGKLVSEPVGDDSWEDTLSWEDTSSGDILYTLEINNHHGICVSDQAEAVLTGWHREGSVEGLATQSFLKQTRIFQYGCAYYCFQDHGLYQSSDGLKWVLAPAGTVTPKITEGDYTACGIWEDYFYVMTGKKDGFLQIARYSFPANKWEYGDVGQYCSSTEAHLSFSLRRGCLAETIPSGISVMECDIGTDWRQWNTNLWDLCLEEGEACSSDFCFWKDEFYGVILCTDGMFRLYRCSEEMEGELYVQRTAGKKIYLLPTVNRLLVSDGRCLYDAAEKKQIRDEFMPDMQEGGWIGSAGQKIFGIFSDGCFWTWQR